MRALAYVLGLGCPVVVVSLANLLLILTCGHIVVPDGSLHISAALGDVALIPVVGIVQCLRGELDTVPSVCLGCIGCCHEVLGGQRQCSGVVVQFVLGVSASGIVCLHLIVEALEGVVCVGVCPLAGVGTLYHGFVCVGILGHYLAHL